MTPIITTVTVTEISYSDRFRIVTAIREAGNHRVIRFAPIPNTVYPSRHGRAYHRTETVRRVES